MYCTGYPEISLKRHDNHGTHARYKFQLFFVFEMQQHHGMMLLHRYKCNDVMGTTSRPVAGLPLPLPSSESLSLPLPLPLSLSLSLPPSPSPLGLSEAHAIIVRRYPRAT